MNASNLEWMKVKSEQMLRNQVNLIAKSEFPASDLADGMLEAFYALGLITDFGYGYWQCQIKLTACDRRDELHRAKCRALFDVKIGELTEEDRKQRKSPVITVTMPGVVNGELINGGMHENGLCENGRTDRAGAGLGEVDP